MLFTVVMSLNIRGKKMRSIHVDEISRNIKEMCIEANYYLSDDMKNALYKAGRPRGESSWLPDS